MKGTCPHNPPHPNINIIVLHMFLKVLTRRICLKNQEFNKLVIISFILVTLMFDSGRYCEEKLDSGHSQGSKG